MNSGIFPSTFLQQVNSSKNSISQSLHVFFFFFVFETPTPYFLIQILCIFLVNFSRNSPQNSKISRKVQEKCIFQLSADLHLKNIFLWCLAWGRVFPTERIRGSPLLPAENLLISPHLEKFPTPLSRLPPHQIFIPLPPPKDKPPNK